MKHTLESLKARTIDQNGCWIWQGAKDRWGYGMVNITRVHRLMYELTNNVPLSEKDVVRHQCDKPSCINPQHMELGTHADNVRDRVARGRSAVGERNGRAKLTVDQVRELKRLLAAGGSTWHLAVQYGVTPKALRQIRDGQTWKNV